jgi:hypothetical protein
MRFQAHFKRALQESMSEGKLNLQEYIMLMDACKRPRRIAKDGRLINLMEETERHIRETAFKGDLQSFWQKLVIWLKENWPEIVKLILSLLVIL